MVTIPIYNNVYSSIKRSRVQITVDQGSKVALRPDQAIKSQFQRSKLLIAVADRSTGHIAVTTPCISKSTWPNFLEQNSFESPTSVDNNALEFIWTNMKIIIDISPLVS